jgi:hypothetical protein
LEKVYVPKAVKAGAFTGSVTMKLLSFDERMELAEESANGTSNVALIRKMVRDYKGKWSKVDLTRVKDGAKFTSLDDLQYGKDCHDVIQETCLWLISGDDDEEKPSPS